ncbi:MAG TPA: ribosomal L7Ae/L30e/S12e/Gadd45 family protein [Clostridia bacterium]
MYKKTTLSNAEVIKLINNSSILVGTRQVLKACAKDALRCVILASDADESLCSKITELCSAHDTEVFMFPSKRELGQIAGIEVASAVVGIEKT